ncbi:sigma-54 dependent transcriptional regulator [Shewanella sp. JM162201]|uniref:Sigma-54 dependent transcriptional regulator n=1 Tax=Shewanella jiangmenensis TaxID=2837387 RepID=A0ABS5V7S4_9GAMM|nr:sigma-54 dependent transcriptional regulator [Shewanella jiangmenensis]MBT1445078.1 sigma-54 dependent transcriptional regulator [Shewanella jiangmenensis]
MSQQKQCRIWSLSGLSVEDRVLLDSLASLGWAFPAEAECGSMVGLAFVQPKDELRKVMEQLAAHSRMLWIVVCDNNQLSELSRLFSLGIVFDFHHRPVQIELLSATLGHGLGVHKELLQLPEPSTFSHDMTGLYDKARRIAGTDISVVIHGPSGSGKEYLARYIHQHSGRSAAPFVSLNCAGLPANLIQDELFGHEKGAFTGANQAHAGVFEQAKGGTLLLDEIGDLPLELQGNFLQVLQQKSVRRLGSARYVPVDCRIIAASHKKLSDLVSQGGFREDLFYRLNVIHLEVPALAQRRDEVLPLAEYFLEQYAERYGVRKHLSTEARFLLQEYHWPGNIRQLQNVLISAATLSDTSIISGQELNLEHPQTELASPLADQVRLFEQQTILRAVRMNGGCRNKAARQLGISRHTLYRKIRQSD